MHISDQGRNKLDPKSKKCTFIGYGDDEFGYRIWDGEHKKVIRSRDAIFNEKVMYKDMHKTNSNDSVQSESIFADVNIDDVLDSPMTEPIVASPQLEEIVGQNSVQQSNTPQPPTQTHVLRRSSRPHMPNRRYMNYLLLTDGWESECYDEACQTEDVSKCELAMKEETKSLISN